MFNGCIRLLFGTFAFLLKAGRNRTHDYYTPSSMLVWRYQEGITKSLAYEIDDFQKGLGSYPRWIEKEIPSHAGHKGCDCGWRRRVSHCPHNEGPLKQAHGMPKGGPLLTQTLLKEHAGDRENVFLVDPTRKHDLRTDEYVLVFWYSDSFQQALQHEIL